MTAPHVTVSGTKTLYPVALLLRGTESKGGLPFSHSTNMLLSQASVNVSWASEKKREEDWNPLQLFSKNKIKCYFIFYWLQFSHQTVLQSILGNGPGKYKHLPYPEKKTMDLEWEITARDSLTYPLIKNHCKSSCKFVFWLFTFISQKRKVSLRTRSKHFCPTFHCPMSIAFSKSDAHAEEKIFLWCQKQS